MKEHWRGSEDKELCRKTVVRQALQKDEFALFLTCVERSVCMSACMDFMNESATVAFLRNDELRRAGVAGAGVGGQRSPSFTIRLMNNVRREKTGSDRGVT